VADASGVWQQQIFGDLTIGVGGVWGLSGCKLELQK